MSSLQERLDEIARKLSDEKYEKLVIDKTQWGWSATWKFSDIIENKETSPFPPDDGSVRDCDEVNPPKPKELHTHSFVCCMQGWLIGWTMGLLAGFGLWLFFSSKWFEYWMTH